jgi:DNA (cytosine-5)-methyltransferase 1
MFKVIDLFCGVGGYSYGFENHISKNFKIVFSADNWQQAVDNYKINLSNSKLSPTKVDLADERFVKTQFLRKFKGKVDIVIGGPPCQPFSTLGSRSSLDDRLKLVYSFLEYCYYLKPKIFIMENVKGIAMKDGKSGESFSNIVKKWFQKRSNNEYICKDYLFNMINIGLAQNRTRYFLVGINKKREEDSASVFSMLEKSIFKYDLKKHKTLKEEIGDMPEKSVAQNSQKYLYNHNPLNHSAKLTKRFSFVPPGGGLMDVPIRLLPKHLKKMRLNKYGSGGHVKNIYGRLVWNKPAGTIVAGIDKITCGRYLHPKYNRLLTPRECARLQSFPDNFIFKGSMVTQYYLIGNAVPPKFSQKLADVIIKILK